MKRVVLLMIIAVNLALSPLIAMAQDSHFRHAHQGHLSFQQVNRCNKQINQQHADCAPTMMVAIMRPHEYVIAPLPTATHFVSVANHYRLLLINDLYKPPRPSLV